MQAIEHRLVHHYQPTNHSCGQTATAMLLSHLGENLSPEDVIEAVPVLSVGDCAEWGTLSQSLATWLIGRGYKVEMHTADFQLIDLEWAGLSRGELLQRMQAAKSVRNVASLGKELSAVALQAYIEFVTAGGEFHIHSHMTTALLNGLLANGPVFINVSPNVLGNYGRSIDAGLRESTRDDLDGGLDTHFVVLYGVRPDGSYLIADPWTEPGRREVHPELLLCAMTAGQIQCENTIFQARKHRA